jgi:hypothetical protein
MGQAKLRGSLDERRAAAEGRSAKPTKDELRLQELLSRREVPEGRIGVAVHEKGKLIAVHHFPVEDFVEGRVIPASGVVQKMKGVLKGDPTVDAKALHYLRHAGLDRLRSRSHQGWGFLLWTVVNDPEVGAQIRERLAAVVAEKGRAALMLVATDGSLDMIAGEEFPDLERPDVAPAAGRTVHSVGHVYKLV